MRWLEETHSVFFELVRHFFRRLFDGEWSTSSGQWGSAAIGLVSLLLPAGLLLVREASLDPRTVQRYAAVGARGLHSAAFADELALITLLMCVTGLIALLQWQSLFPARRDYLALASLPVRPSQVFAASFASILLFSAVLIGAMIALPSVLAPGEFGGSWRLDLAYLRAAGAQAVSSALACSFTLFSIVALQGLLLNFLPGRIFVRASIYVQALLTGIFLLAGFYSWTMKQWPVATAHMVAEFRWLPPVWFASMSQRAWTASTLAVALTAATYLLSYRRYRELLLESPAMFPPHPRHWSPWRLLAGTPRREAVMDFVAKTLARSRTHRLLWLVYLV